MKWRRRIFSPWYYRKKGASTWIKIGESDDRARNFAVSWDTTKLENGQYEVLGLMHAIARDGDEEAIIARENTIEITVEN